MASEIVVKQITQLAKALAIADSPQLYQTLKNTAFKVRDGEVTDEQLAALLIVASQYGLNPWTKEIYAFPDKSNGIVPVVGIDGWSRMVNSHPQFDGLEFDQNEESCTCKIYRKDRNHPTAITEWMSECKKESFTNKNGYEIKGPWQSHPKRMLRHKAFCQAARMAFGYVGIYDQDEAERIIDINSAPVNPQRTNSPTKYHQIEEEKITESIDMSTGEIVDDIRQKKIDLILSLEQSAKSGLSNLEFCWKALTKEERTLLGPQIIEGLKKTAAKVDETVHVPE